MRQTPSPGSNPFRRWLRQFRIFVAPARTTRDRRPRARLVLEALEAIETPNVLINPISDVRGAIA